MQASHHAAELRHDPSADDEPAPRKPSTWSFATLIGAAALSGGAMHMAKSTTAAQFADTVAQHSTMPTDMLDVDLESSMSPLDYLHR